MFRQQILAPLPKSGLLPPQSSWRKVNGFHRPKARWHKLPRRRLATDRAATRRNPLTSPTGAAGPTGPQGPAGSNATADNLGNHTATQALNLQTNALTGTGASLPAGVLGVGIRADGGLNLGQYTAGNSLYGHVDVSAPAEFYNATIYI